MEALTRIIEKANKNNIMRAVGGGMAQSTAMDTSSQH